MVEEVRKLLQQDYEIVGTAENGAELVEQAQRLNPDLIVSDVSMPIMTGFEAVSKIRFLGLKSQVIFLTVHSTAPYLRKARALGASGYVLKMYTNEQLPAAVAAVLNGGSYTSPELSTNGNR